VFRRPGIEDKSMGEVIDDLKIELKEFVVTRIDMFKAEVNEKLARIKSSVPMLAAAAVFGIGAFFALTFGLVAVVAALVPNDWRWAIGAGAVFLLYLIIGGIVGWMGYREITTEGLAPQRTLRVLKQDQAWIQNEARSA
jgi:uncharacterized membrane protein YqjE